MNTLFNLRGTKYKLRSTKTLFFTVISSLFIGQIYAQEQLKDTTNLEEVVVQSVRANKKTPVTFSNLSKEEFATRNLGQDIPILMNFLPSVVTTSDAGNGFGYSGIRVRGSDATRVNVTINGIPYNDSESHGTFWVNMPDFASSVENLQLQRGVGTSTNGAGAFGASLNMLTDNYSKTANGEISNSFGSFNSRKHTVKFSSGLLNNHFELAGRVSKIASDGYIDRASSDLKSYFLQATFTDKSTLIKALVFGGTEKTYQAWNGIDRFTLENDRTFNPSGMFTDEFGNTRFYDNETDNYQQDHYQLIWNQKINQNWSSNVAFHYTIGKGYYENYREDADFDEYGLTPVAGQTSTDLIRQKWLDNDFYGTVFSLNYKKNALEWIVGGGYNQYEGDHFGKVIWSRFASTSELGDRYYDDFAKKTDFNLYYKLYYKLTNKWLLFGDVQLRNVNYNSNGETGWVDDSFSFFNPKAGITFTINKKNNLYFSYARANREPNRTDYENGNPESEQMDDLELGWRYENKTTQLNVNGYLMNYKNQLILTGALDDVGNPIRANSGKSYRLGLEIDALFKPLKNVILQPNLSVSQNKNQEFYFNRDGVVQNLGDTNIAFSPNVIFNNRLTFIPFKNFQATLLSKFVGEQYMGNIDSENSKLDAYSSTDVNISYEFKPKKVFQSITLSVLLNNIFNEKFESNGYFYTYDDDFSNPGVITTIEGAGYYPQAGFNFLTGLTLKF
ncbi:MAG: TonB-dependent receptor [Flavobacteriales bacterium]|nr:TonB-dependent receptor [Flavobacteriales bacterium]